MTYSPTQFSEKYLLALESTRKDRPLSGLNGLELEWNLLDGHLRPLVTVGTGHARQSFVDFMRGECLPPWLREYSQLEVFHWMVEWVTRPYYQPRGVVYEARLMEAALINALARAGGEFSERLFYWHGNLLFSTAVTHDSIPGNWGIAKRRYLERCVDLYGDTLATAGIHVNLSLPDTLFAWDFMHLPAAERGERHLDQYKSEFYITATRTLRAFAALFIATSASTPLQAQLRGKRKVVVLTPFDSVRNLTFPNPPEIDQPDLYCSYKEYKRISYDLVRQGVRFGNNNWTPVRARSFAEPVERLISMTGDQLDDLYTRGLYSIGEDLPAEEMARQIEQQNLLARINLPMGRVEIRTDDGGHPLEVDVANMTLKHLLLIRIYADPEFARGFRYDSHDINRARRNEGESARRGLHAEIENPFSGEQIKMRSFLKWTLDEIEPLARLLGMWEDLSPLVEMAAGGPNTAEKLRSHLQMKLGANDEVPLSLLRSIAEQRETQVMAEVEKIAAGYLSLGDDAAKIGQFLGYARDEARQHPDLPVRFRPASGITIKSSYSDKSSEIVDLAQHLIRIPSVTACPDERFDEVHRAGTFIYDYLRGHGLEARYFDGKYPAVYAAFPPPRKRSGTGVRGGSPILLSGHFDVVEPDPDDSQFTPRIEGDYLWGRGAADMKTVVATYMVWMKDVLRSGKSFPDIALLLVGNEENGESEAWGTPFVMKELDLQPVLFIAGERTGEKGDELYGEVCIENRGIMRFEVVARGQKGHSGVSGAGGDLGERLIQARAGLMDIFDRQLTLSSSDGWQSQAKFPFINVGRAGIYNITAAEGIMGVEIRPIPQDDIRVLREEVEAYCGDFGLEVSFSVMEDGVACDPRNTALMALLASAKQAWGAEPKIGKKLPGTSARFAPGGQGVVWGESGIGPHARDERHFIPSIQPYYQALNELAKQWK
jgi:succinyl-diaminopimelate desuccinylase